MALTLVNENEEMFANLYANNLAIGRTIFPHKPCHLATWVSLDRRAENQSDHICIARRFRRNLQDVRVKLGAYAALDHYLLLAKVKFKLLENLKTKKTQQIL